MKISSLLVLAAAGVGFVCNSSGQNFARSVVSFEPGAGAASGFNNTDAVLGAPSQVNPFGEPTDPFDPPYGTAQVLSLGEGGSVTIEFAQPVHNRPNHPFGVDFNIFGNTGFIVTNDFDFSTFNWVGVPATDGSLFANNPGQTRVSVSRDGVHFYALDPNLAPTVDGMYPTDGAGDPTKPMDPTLSPTACAGQTLAGLSEMYHGSAGGTGYNIAWARDNRGRPAHLSFIRFVRVEVITGKAEIDAFCAVAGSK